MNKNILAILVLGLSLGAQATGIKILSDDSSKKLFSNLNVAIIDADDILEKHFIATNFSMTCFKSVVDKSASCHVPDETISIEGADAKKLYRALKTKIEDHDDILNRSLVLADFKIECEYGVVDKVYSCLLTP